MIRNHANRVAKFHHIEKICKQCGYSTHVDLCHIKSIGSFDKNTKVSEINSLSNLVYLCKNHHWELDNNILKLEHQIGFEPTTSCVEGKNSAN